MAQDVIARGMAASAQEYAEQIETIVESLKNGIKWKGAVDYYSSLPSGSSVSEGDAYTVKYKGSSGTVPSGAEYVWGNYDGILQWISLGQDIPSGTSGQMLQYDSDGTLQAITPDNTPTDSSTNPVTSGGVKAAIDNVSSTPSSAVSYVTTAPTEANTNGLKFAVLSTEPATKYSGWLYIITA